jgi:chemotaxis protein CheD
MRIDDRGDRKRIIIEPGEYYVSNENIVISTLLGSCVSACLFDPVNRVIGMNHFLLSNKRYAKDIPVCVTEAGRYGIHAMELLINEMMKKGAKRSKLKAKAFGGGNVLKYEATHDNFFCVGDVNCRFVREFLDLENIPLVASALGGENGRVIHFSHGDYAVLVRKIKSTITSKVAQKERTFWRNKIETQEKESASADIWG